MPSLSTLLVFSPFLSCLGLEVSDDNIYTIEIGFDCESVDYDTENDWWLLADSTNNVIKAWDPEGATDPTGGVFGPIYNPQGYNASDPGLFFPSGMYRDNDNDILYVGNLGNGYIFGIDVTSNETVYSLQTGGQPNGMCYNSENNKLYVTDTAAQNDGTQQIWELNMDLTVSRSFLTSTSNVYPNGCIVEDDTLYVVQFYNYDDEDIIDNIGVVYWTDISSDNPTRKRAGAPHGELYVDGIVMDPNGNLWIDSWGSDPDGETVSGSLWYLAAEDISSNTSVWKQVTGDVFQSPANMAFDTDLGWLLIPSFFGEELYVVNPVLEDSAFNKYQGSAILVSIISLLALLFN